MERLILIFFLFLNAISLNSADIESAAKRIIARAMAEPSLFFMEMKSDSESALPVKPGSRYSFNYSIFPSFFPLIFVSPSFSKRVLAEGDFPQIDFGVGVQYFGAQKLITQMSDDVEKISFWGYNMGFTASNSLTSKIRNFYGLRYSYSSSELELTADKKHELIGVELRSFKFKRDALFVFLGVETMKDINRYFAIQLNYDLINGMIVMKTSWYGKWFELGLNFYPDGVIPVHPVWNMRLNF